MPRIATKRPSPALVIALLALFVAVGGGSFAVAALTSGEKRVVKRIANKQITKRAIQGRTIDLNLDRGDPITKIATVGPYEISGRCAGIPETHTAVIIFAKGPAGHAETIYDRVKNDATDLGNNSRADVLSADVGTEVFSDQVNGTGYIRFGGTTVLRSNSGAVVQVDFSALAWHDAAACHVWGTATTGR